MSGFDSESFEPVSLDKIKSLLGAYYSKYQRELFSRQDLDFCGECRKSCMKAYGDFHPLCNGSATDQFARLDLSQYSEYERLMARITIDPVEWAATKMKWFADWYQAQALRCTSLFRTMRWGRRSGKTEAMCIAILHHAATKPGKEDYEMYTVLVVTPYESQLNRIFDSLRNLLARAADIKPTRDVRNPNIIEFANGASIQGFTAGKSTGARSVKIRGMDADMIVLDEADFFTEEDLEAILAIQASHPRCEIWMSGTPTGAKTKFWMCCTDPKLKFKEFWRVSLESPRYTQQSHEFFLAFYGEKGFEREILALFGEPEEGVFAKRHLDSSLRDYEFKNCKRTADGIYMMGVDWNDRQHGVHIVVNEWNRKDELFKLVDKAVVRGDEFTQIDAMNKMLELDKIWHPKYIAVDRGYGHTQVELLRQFSKRHPHLRFDERLFDFNMGAKVQVLDPLTGQRIQKPIKPLMLSLSAARLERGEQIFPNSEDDEKTKGLVDQLRVFKQTGITPEGRPIYSKEYDHTLTAWCLTVLIFMLKETHLGMYEGGIQFVAMKPKEKEDGMIRVEEKDQEPLRTYDTSNTLFASTSFRPKTRVGMRRALRPGKRSNI